MIVRIPETENDGGHIDDDEFSSDTLRMTWEWRFRCYWNGFGVWIVRRRIELSSLTFVRVIDLYIVQ
jgi:hypothetical protein